MEGKNNLHPSYYKNFAAVRMFAAVVHKGVVVHKFAVVVRKLAAVVHKLAAVVHKLAVGNFDHFVDNNFEEECNLK